jgi:hypothetical protein
MGQGLMRRQVSNMLRQVSNQSLLVLENPDPAPNRKTRIQSTAFIES